MNIDIAKIKGLIFDLDGTLADTMPLHLEAWNEIGEKHGLFLSHEDHLKYAGMPTKMITEKLAKEKGIEVDSDEFTRQKETLFTTQKLQKVQPIKAVLAFLHNLDGKLPMAIGTGSNRATALKVVTTLQVADYVKAVVTAEDVTNHKPAPDTFLMCAEKIGIAPENCLVFEDANLGMQAALTGGMQAINITEESDDFLAALLKELEQLH